MHLAIYLPNLRVDDCGVTLEEFFRNLATAVKVASTDNYQFPLYSEHLFQPLTGESPNLSSNDYVMFQQNLLAKYQVLPEEKSIIDLYPVIVDDASRAAREQDYLATETFYKRYLLPLAESPILDAVDSLFFFLAQRSTRLLSAHRGLDLIRDLFLDRGLIERTEPAAWPDLTDAGKPDLASGRVEVALPFKMLPEDTVYICRDVKERPLESSNSFFVRFSSSENGTQSAAIDFYLSPDEERVYIEGSPARATIDRGVRDAFFVKFPALRRLVQAGEAQIS